jgi:predicted  nucleic acid-binding Zn-ribbon protein
LTQPGHDRLADLLAVQDLDLALDQIRHRRAALPERAELARLDDDQRTFGRELAETQEARAEVAGRQSAAEAELAATEERSAVIDKRLYSGESGSRDLQAMSGELDHLKARASGLEDAVLEALEAAEPLDGRIAGLHASLDELAANRERLLTALAAEDDRLGAETTEMEDRRREAAARVPADLMATYERLRSRLGGVGVARLVGNHCDGCHLTLSAVELDRVRHQPEGEIYTCEQCSRILVP